MERAFIVTSCIELQDRHDRVANPIKGNGLAIQEPLMRLDSRAIAQLGLARTRVIHRYWVTLAFSAFQLVAALAVKVDGSLVKFCWPLSLAKT